MDAQNNCDVIENTACGKAFKYCRTHKVEAHECPVAVNNEPHSSEWSMINPPMNFEIAPRYQAPKRSGRESAYDMVASGLISLEDYNDLLKLWDQSQ